MIIASIAGHVEVVERLLRAGANKEAQSQFGTAAVAASNSLQDPHRRAAILDVLNAFSDA